MKHFLPLLAIALLLGCTDQEPQQASPVIIGSSPAMSKVMDQPAPAISTQTLSGDAFELDALRGEVVVVNFWATWCAPCVKETPELVALQKEWEDRPFVIVGVSEDLAGPEIVREFVERYAIPYPILVDDGAIADAFGGVYAMPSTYVIDHRGRVVHRVIGVFPFAEMRPVLESLIAAAG